MAGEYVWADNELKPYRDVNTPLYLAFGSDTSARFTPVASAQTEQFAKVAIEDQPMAYARVVIDDVLHTFGWNRQPDPSDYYGNGPNFQFVSAYAMNQQIPWYATPYHIPGNPYTQPATVSQLASNTPTWCNASCQTGRPAGGPDHDGRAGLRRPGSRARVHHGGPALGSSAGELPAVHLPARYPARPYPAHRRGGRARPLAPLGRCRPAALAGRGAADRAAADDRRVQLPVRAGRGAGGLPGRRPGLHPSAGQPPPLSVGPGGRPPKPPRSVRGLAADLRRNLGRGGTVDQE